MIDPAQQLVTVFGGSGFIGRYVCEFLLRSGARVRVASRNPRSAHHLQPLGQVGQVGVVRTDVTNAASVARAMAGATAAINLTGTFGGAVRATHVDGAAHIARAARDAGAAALVHVSAIGADPAADSTYGQTKGDGERAVREAFAGATILRPSVVFGPEDQLTNRFAQLATLPYLPVLAAQTRFQPVYVRDLAQAVVKALLEPGTFGGKTFEIGGPQVLTMRELHEEILAVTGQTPELVETPSLFGRVLSSFGWLPGAPLTRDQWTMLQNDNVAAPGTPGLDAFGIAPTPLAAVAPEWLGRFHTGGRFAGSRANPTAG